MSVTSKLSLIIEELNSFLTFIDDEQLDSFLNEILKAKRIFLVGKGRSGVAIQAFTNRLLHLGFDVHLVGEISAPKAREGDLLIIGSGSGTTSSLVSLAEIAVKNNVRIATITMDKEAHIPELSNVIITLPGSSPKLKIETVKSVQPMGSAFEQLSLLTYDAIILELMDRLQKDSDEMFLNHTNFE